jgi:hypothetical protein
MTEHIDSDLYDLSELPEDLQEVAAGFLIDGQLLSVTVTQKDDINGNKPVNGNPSTIYYKPMNTPALPLIVEWLVTQDEAPRHILHMP